MGINMNPEVDDVVQGAIVCADTFWISEIKTMTYLPPPPDA